MFLGTKIAFINIEGGLSVFDTKSETQEELLDNSSFVSAIFSQYWWIYLYCYFCFMFQKTLNTTKYSLSPSLSFLLLSYDQSGHQSKYKLINLKKRLEYYPHWESATHFKHFMFQCEPSWVSPGWRTHKQSCLGDRQQPHPAAWKYHLLHGIETFLVA